jgi:hypothetical protein
MKKIIYAWILLLLAVYVSVPRDFLHAWHDCEDTFNHIDHAQSSVSREHHHCKLLQLDAPPVALVFDEPFYYFSFLDCCLLFAELCSSACRSSVTFHLRGPPQTV